MTDAMVCLDSGRPLGWLVHAVRAMAAERDPIQALWTLICAVRTDLELDRAGVFEFDQERQTVARLVGVDAAGHPEYGTPPVDIHSRPGPLAPVGLGALPYYLSDNVTRDYPGITVDAGVTSLVVVPIIIGGQVRGMLCADNCYSGRRIPESVIQPLFLYAGLAAQSLFAIYQQKERERVDTMRRAIYTEVFQAATNGKIQLRSLAEIGAEWPGMEESLPIEHERDISVVRDTVRATAEACGILGDRAWDLTLCASEAATNALRHGNGGSAAVAGRDGVVRVKVVDRGRGIPLEDLPDAALRAGWSRGKTPSMGHGFSLMYQLADCLYLNTGPEGTVLILEMHVSPPEFTPAAWDGLL